MKDRLTRGFLAGAISGVVCTIFNMLLGTIGLNTLRWIDWMGIITYDHVPPFTVGETLFTFFGIVVFTGVLGIVFAYFVPALTSKNLLLKGFLWGVTIWFIIDGITTLFTIEGTTPLPLMSAISAYITASLYGLLLASLLTIFEHGKVTSALGTQPAMKPLDESEDSDKE